MAVRIFVYKCPRVRCSVCKSHKTPINGRLRASRAVISTDPFFGCAEMGATEIRGVCACAIKVGSIVNGVPRRTQGKESFLPSIQVPTRRLRGQAGGGLGPKGLTGVVGRKQSFSSSRPFAIKRSFHSFSSSVVWLAIWCVILRSIALADLLHFRQGS